MSRTEDILSVKIMQCSETEKPYLRVELRSLMKTGAVSQYPIYNLTDGDHVRREVQAGSGALAEHQNELYGDHHDPEEIAKDSVEVLKRLVDHLKSEGLA